MMNFENVTKLLAHSSHTLTAGFPTPADLIIPRALRRGVVYRAQ